MSRTISPRFSAAIAGFVVGGLVLSLGGPVPALGQSFEGTVRDVLDGDTVHLLRETGQLVRMDLYGVDAPELGQPYGSTAARALRRAVFRKRVRAVAEGSDEDGRPLFVLYADGETVNEQLVQDGLAWWDRRRAGSDDRLRRLERRARAAERGLWAEPNPVPPWEWRARKESERGEEY